MSEPDTTGPSDQALLVRIAKGEAEAIEAFYARWYERFVRLALRLTGDPHVAQDLAQDTILRVITRAGSYSPDRPARGWMLQILHNTVTDWSRRMKVRQAMSLSESDSGSATSLATDSDDEADPARRPASAPSDVPAREPTAQERAEARERLDAVSAALQQLSQAERLIIVLRDYEGLSASETAAILGITADRVGSRLFRARNRLRQLLEANWPDLFAQR